MADEWNKGQEVEDSILKIDPNRTVFSNNPEDYVYLSHPDGVNKTIKVDRATGQIDHKTLMAQQPVTLPESLREVGQRRVPSCHMPTDEVRGCWAANGCPIYKMLSQQPPDRREFPLKTYNVIIFKNGYYDSVKCFHAYTGRSKSGFPTSQSNYLGRGWRIVTDRTTIPQNIIKTTKDEDGNKIFTEVVEEKEVSELAPFYKDAIAARDAAKNPKPEPKQKRKYTKKEKPAA